jgi:hypothetical protein
MAISPSIDSIFAGILKHIVFLFRSKINKMAGLKAKGLILACERVQNFQVAFGKSMRFYPKKQNPIEGFVILLKTIGKYL